MNTEVISDSKKLFDMVKAGLSEEKKSLPPKLLYDKRGSEIFESICNLPEYYPTRSEKEILQSFYQEMVDLFPEDTILIEPGSGSGEKIKYLLSNTKKIKAYVPIEISHEILFKMTEELKHQFPSVSVHPVHADFTNQMAVPLDLGLNTSRVIFFPGSTIGNFNPAEAEHFLKECAKIISIDGGILIGVDLKKDVQKLQLAYDDPSGVTASFNLNLLDRLNREMDGNFNVQNFSHKAYYNEVENRIEMHLESNQDQEVVIAGINFHFKKNETIHTESSYKYTTIEFCELCAKAKLQLAKCWKDREEQFCVYYFKKKAN